MAAINWKVRFKNKAFWMAFIPALVILIQMALGIFGIDISLDGITGRILAFVDALFAVLVIVGVVTDPTTNGVSDGENGISYEEPAPNVKNG